jgi:hypothetical protein
MGYKENWQHRNALPSGPVAAPNAPEEVPKTLRAFKSQFLKRDGIVKDTI